MVWLKFSWRSEEEIRKLVLKSGGDKDTKKMSLKHNVAHVLQSKVSCMCCVNRSDFWIWAESGRECCKPEKPVQVSPCWSCTPGQAWVSAQVPRLITKRGKMTLSKPIFSFYWGTFNTYSKLLQSESGCVIMCCFKLHANLLKAYLFPVGWKESFSPYFANAAISVSHSMTFNIFAKFNLCKISCLVVLRAVLLILAVCGQHSDWHWKRQPQGSCEKLASPALLCCTGPVEQPLLCGQKGSICSWQIRIFNWSTEEAAAVFLWSGKLQGFGIWWRRVGGWLGVIVFVIFAAAEECKEQVWVGGGGTCGWPEVLYSVCNTDFFVDDSVTCSPKLTKKLAVSILPALLSSTSHAQPGCWPCLLFMVGKIRAFVMSV